jgi:transposase
LLLLGNDAKTSIEPRHFPHPGATVMSKIPVFVGLDYHQSSVQVCVMEPSGKVLANRKCTNLWQAVAGVVQPCSSQVLAAIEACNGAANLADELVEKAGWSVDLAHPGYVARIKQSPDKTDFSDAQLLADLERVGYLPKVWHAPERIRELRRLVRYRQQVVEQQRSTKLRVRALLRDHRITIDDSRPWTKAWLARLAQSEQLPATSSWIVARHLVDLARFQSELRQLEAKLSQELANDRLAQALLTIPGIGLVTAATMRAEIGRFDRFRTGKQLARFCGLSPRNASSGKKQADSGVIRAGNAELRRVLTQAAHRLIMHEPRWSKLASSMKQRGKPVPLIVAAVANRWIRSLHHQLQHYGLAV